jgi:hypothetical protein
MLGPDAGTVADAAVAMDCARSGSPRNASVPGQTFRPDEPYAKLKRRIAEHPTR